MSNIETKVELKTLCLRDLLGVDTRSANYNLKIPEYQRIYCWEEKQVYRMLNDIKERSSGSYHLGTIILHKRENNQYDIVDGQQRLVTLALLLFSLDENIEFGLLEESFTSSQAENYVAYNKWLIQGFLEKTKKIEIATLLNNIVFSVLILESTNLDLAYTFFSSENGKGKSLTDYDLLKSHHLRFVHIAKQAEHLADRWDDLIRSSNNNDTSRPLARTMGIHLFRLRKWMRKRRWNEDEKRKIKNHFEAAPIIPNIPPFGEQFNFYETIQGGTHFFAYAEHFVQRFEQFTQLNEYNQLHRFLSWEKHWWYRDVIESLLFAYFLKFGQQYISESFEKIIDLVSQHRYGTSRAYLSSIVEHVSQKEIIMMIDQATSPTFFLAEMKASIALLPMNQELKGTRARFENNIQNIKKNLGISNSKNG